MANGEVLSRLVRIARRALLLHRAMNENGYTATPYFDLYAETADAICILIGESRENFADTVTCQALNNDSLSDDQRVRVLKTAGAA